MKEVKKRMHHYMGLGISCIIVILISVLIYIGYASADVWIHIADGTSGELTGEIVQKLFTLLLLSTIFFVILAQNGQILFALASQSDAWLLVGQLARNVRDVTSTCHMKTEVNDICNRIEGKASTFTWKLLGGSVTGDEIKQIQNRVKTIFWSSVVLPAVIVVYSDIRGRYADA